MDQPGTEWIVDVDGRRADTLRDLGSLQALFDCIIAELQLKPLGEAVWHRFPGEGGVTGIVLLAESHLAIHTWPETGTAAIDLFCCLPRATWHWEARLREMLGAARVRVRLIERGIEAR